MLSVKLLHNNTVFPCVLVQVDATHAVLRTSRTFSISRIATLWAGRQSVDTTALSLNCDAAQMISSQKISGEPHHHQSSG